MRETNVLQICCFAEMMMPYIKIHYANEAAQGSRKTYSRMEKYILFFPVPAALRAQLGGQLRELSAGNRWDVTR